MSSLSESSILSGASGSTGTAAAHQVSQSIRFNYADKALITQDSGGSFVKETTSTISMWVKRGGYYAGSGTRNVFYGAYYASSGRYDYLQFQSDDSLEFGSRDTDATTATGSNNPHRKTSAFFRDVSAWYHIVLAIDTTNDVASERLRLFVNGARITEFQTETAIPQNRGYYTMSDGVENNIGAFQDNTSYSSELYFDGYMAEIALIDGTAYDASNFGEYSEHGIWRPIDISDLTFGSNGIYYKGQDASALGDDSSGNTNDGTLRNFTAQDQVLDSPTNNFCVLNSADKYSYDSGQTVRGVRDQGLAFISKPAGNQNGFGAGNMAVKSGKWYYEMYTTTYPAGEALGFGYADVQNCATATAAPTRDFGLSNRYTTSAYTSWFWGTSSSTSTGLTPYGQGVVMGVYTDFDNNELKVYKDGVLYGSVDFDSTSPTDNLTSEGIDWVPRFTLANDQTAKIHVNFGQDDSFNGNKTSGSAAASDDNGFGRFYYTPLTGYLAICSQNLGA